MEAPFQAFILQSLDVNGATLEYVEKGQGSTVILVHGSLTDYRSWGPQLQLFSKYFHVLAYSRRSHYPNKWFDYPLDYSMRTERDDLVALIYSLGLSKEPVHLFGASYGGAVSLLVGRNYPELVQSLIVAEPPIMSFLTSNPADLFLLEEFRRAVVNPATTDLMRGDVESEARIFVNSVFGSGAFEMLPSSIRGRILDNARTLLPEIQTSPERDPFTCNDASKVLVPTLLLSAERSPIFLHRISDELERCMPNNRRQTIRSASHTFVENITEFNQAALTFLKEHSTQSDRVSF